MVIWNVRFRGCFSSKTLAMTRFFATVFMKGYMSRPLNFICKKRCADIAYGRGLGFATKAGILRVGAIFLCLLKLSASACGTVGAQMQCLLFLSYLKYMIMLR